MESGRDRFPSPEPPPLLLTLKRNSLHRLKTLPVIRQPLPSGGGRTIIGNVWGDAFRSVEADGTRTLTAVREELYARHAAGDLVALVDDARPGAPRFEGVGAAVEAVEHMLSGRNVGKVVVRVAWDA